MLNDAAVIHTVVWDPTEPTATRPLLLQTPSGCYTYGFDHAKNVTELFDSSGGTLAAAYDYAPFGAPLLATGPAAALNPFRFSSEVWDGTLGLVQYLYRPLNPFDGRFINRDPIGERGGLNLYAIVGNNPVNRWDYLGMSFWNCCDDCKETIIDSTEIRVFPASHKDRYLRTLEHSQSLLDALGAGGRGSDVADLAMSMTSLSGLLLSAAKIAINRGMNAGADDALNNGLHRLRSNLDGAYGMAAGYLATVTVKYRPCDTNKTCWKLRSYKTWGSFKTKTDTTPGNYNADPAYQEFNGYRLPDEQKTFNDVIKNTLKEVIDGLP
jgi:RHS repeat-associated protein